MFALKKYFSFLIIGLFLFVYGASSEAAAAPPATGQQQTDAPFHYEPVGYVTVPRLNVRSGPSTQHSVLTAVPYGETVYLIGRSTPGNWLQVRLPSGQRGWVMTQYVSASPEEISGLPVTDTHNIPPTDPTGYVLSPRLNVRQGPGFDRPVIGQLWQGEQVLLTGRNNNSTWVQVRLPSYTTGWVSAQYIRTSVPVYNLPIVDGGPQQPPAYSGFVTVYSLNVRSGPGLYNPVITRLDRGQQVNVYGRDASGGWFKVGLPNGTTGWVMSRYIQIDIPVTNLQVM